MCRTQTITHTCNHSVTIRLSTCRGTYASQHRLVRPLPSNGKAAKAACHSPPTLTLHSGGACGPCQLREWEEAWRVRLEVAAASTCDEVELAGLNTLYASESWDKWREWPSRRFIRYARPALGVRASLLRGSLLRREVKPEGVEEPTSWTTVVSTSNDGGWAGWNNDGNWPSLSDELALAEAEKEDAVAWDRPWPDPTAPVDLEEEERLAAKSTEEGDGIEWGPYCADADLSGSDDEEESPSIATPGPTSVMINIVEDRGRKETAAAEATAEDFTQQDERPEIGKAQDTKPRILPSQSTARTQQDGWMTCSISMLTNQVLQIGA